MSFTIQAVDASDNTITRKVSDISDISVIARQPRSAKPHTHYQLGDKHNVVSQALSPTHDEWVLDNPSVKKQLDFADSDVEILDLGDLATHNTDLYVDQLTTAYDWPKTHSFSTPAVEAHLEPLLSAQAAFDAATFADKFLLVPPTNTPVDSSSLDGPSVQDEPDGSTVSLGLPSASDTSTGTTDTSIITGPISTGDTDLGLAAAASGTETAHSDGDAGADADVLAGTAVVPPSTDSTVESASATAPGESVYAEPTSATVTAETPAPFSASGATGESGASTTDLSPTSATAVETGTVSVELGAVSAPTSASSDAVSVDLGPPLSIAGTPSAEPTPPVFVTASVPPAAIPSSSSVVPPVATYNSDSDSDSDMAETSSSTRFAPPKFQGLTTENAKDWIREFEHYCLYKDMNGPKKLALFKVLLTSSAAIWLENLPATTLNSWENVKAAFETRYNPPGFMKYKHANDLFNKKQGSMTVDDFCAQMQRLAREVGAPEDMLRFAVINGFNPEIRNHVTRAQPTTWTELVQQAKVGEMCMTVPASTDPTLAVKLEAIQDQLTQLALNKQRAASPVCFAGRSESRGRSSRPDSPARRVRFDRSADRGVQEYRNTGPHEDRRSRSMDCQTPNNNWENRGRSQRWDNGPTNRGHSGTSRGRGFPQRQGQFSYGPPRTFGF